MKQTRTLRAAVAAALQRRGAALTFALAAGAGAPLLLAPSSARAETVHDFTNGGSAVINGATFTTGVFQPAGTGFIDSFVRIKDSNDTFVQGYNTGDRSYDNSGNFNPAKGGKAQFDAIDDPNYTRNLLLSDLQVVNNNYVFRLDINQNSGGDGAKLSLREVRIFQSDTASLNQFNTATNDFGNASDETLRYRMDGPTGGDTRIDLNFDFNNGGSGIGDMFLFVPTSFFGSQKYVYLYSEFGNEAKNSTGSPYPNNDGYEEWAALKGPGAQVVPLPRGAYLGLALLGAVIGFRQFRRSAVAR